MADKTYPIGTKIKFISDYSDCNNKIGKIVDIIHGHPLIYIPESKEISQYATKERPATVQTGWWNIERIIIKNQQLLFAFME